MKKIVFIAIALVLSTAAWSQLTFTERPSDLRLYPRDVATNKASVIFAGTVTASGNTLMRILTYRQGVLLATSAEQPATQNSTFNFALEITAEAAQYSFDVQLFNGGWTTVNNYQNIVAGDAIIIHGQSNAESAQVWSGSSLPGSYNNATPNSFIRVFGSGSPTLSNTDLTNMQWFPADGNGSSTANGNAGQWGYVLAYNLIQSKGIPIAIFNGAHGGQGIDFFKRAASPTDLGSNYGRLYSRINKAGFLNSIRAIFWFQGESDADLAWNPRENSASYKSKLQALYNNWKSDYATPGQRFYFTQIRAGCNGQPDRTQFINEAIREVAEENSGDTRVYNTGSLQQEGPGQGDALNPYCHYRFPNGYEKLGNDWTPVIKHDLYGDPLAPNTLSPRVIKIERTELKQLTLTMATSDALTITPGSLANFYFDGASVQPTITATSTANRIVIQLDAYPAGLTGLSYNEDHKGLNAPDIVNGSAFLSMINFTNYPILLGTFPSKILSFTADANEDHSIDLRWTVVNEENVSRYEIQYGLTTAAFTTVGTRQATNATDQHNYDFVYHPVSSAAHFYRLMIVDFDGKVTYSQVLTFKTISAGSMTVAANGRHHTNEINVRINSPVESKMNMKIFTAVGELIVNKPLLVRKGVNQINLDAGKVLPAGVYILQVQGDTVSQTVRFVIE
jgi:carbohydrate esterase-like sialic acid-specific acetylesterase